jgi:site-specific DNA recombinase
VLFRPLYRGEFVWNQTRKRNAWGEKRGSARPEAEWIRQPRPELRIVPEELWQAAHARIDQARQAYREATKGSAAVARG